MGAVAPVCHHPWMGKHGRVAARKRVPFPAVALGVLLLAGIVTGSRWWSTGTPSDPIDQNPVAAVAFVLSSSSCTDHGRGTVVELLPTSGRRVTAVIDGCGYSDGEKLAVEYLAGNPTQARLAGTSSPSGTDDLRQWWPIVLGILAVLAAGFAVVLVVGGGRLRRLLRSLTRYRGGAAPDGQDPVAQLTAMVSTSADRVAPSVRAVGVIGAHRGGRHALLDFDEQSADDRPADDRPAGDRPADEQPADDRPADERAGGDVWLLNTNDDGWLLEPAQSWAAEISVGGDGQLPPDDDASLPFRLDLVFPSTAELAASLHDELFTHRHAQVSGG